MLLALIAARQAETTRALGAPTRSLHSAACAGSLGT